VTTVWRCGGCGLGGGGRLECESGRTLDPGRFWFSARVEKLGGRSLLRLCDVLPPMCVGLQEFHIRVLDLELTVDAGDEIKAVALVEREIEIDVQLHQRTQIGP